MRKALISILILIGGGLLFVNLFFRESMGLNTVIFTFPLLVLTLIKHRRKGPYSVEVAFTAAATFLAALAIIGNASLLAKTMYWLSLLLFLGFIQHQYLKFIPFTFIAILSYFVQLPWLVFTSWSSKLNVNSKLDRILKKSFQLLLPLGVFFVFFFLYYVANSKFGGLVDQVIDKLFQFGQLQFNPAQVILFILGFSLFALGVLTAPFNTIFASLQKKFSLNLLRQKNKRWFAFKVSKNPLILKDRFKTGVITLTMLNALLIVVNLIDLRFVWFNRRTLTAAELSEYVHEGTGILIFAVLIAAIVVMLIFRKNLNFFPNNEGLKKLAYIWIGQNIFMVFSVANRNFQYLLNHGLTHKRIGVFVFLIIVTVGLVSLYIKVRDRKSSYFLWHRNNWSVYLILLLTSFINWNLLITRINIHSDQIKNLDAQYLINELPAQNAFLLKKNEAKLFSTYIYDKKYLKTQLNDKILRAKKSQNLRSWNWPYHLNKKYLD